jgi:protein-disulfide isomerase
VAATACQRPERDPRLDAVLAKLDSIEKRLVAQERRLPVAGAAAAAAPSRPRADPNSVYYLPVEDTDAVVGPKNAKVTIVEVFEFACPHCKNTSPVVEAVRQKYPSDVRVVFASYIIHPDLATLPALAMCAANRQGKVAGFVEALWKRAWPDSGFNRDAVTVASLEALAKEQGLDLGRFKADSAGDFCKADLEAKRRALPQVGVTGTPALYINGRPYQGQRTASAITAFVDEELAKANKAVAGGTRAEDYYASLMESAKRSL